MRNQKSFMRLTRVPVLAAILLLVSTGIAGVPIRVSWNPNPVMGNLPTDLTIELDQPATVAQPVAVMFDTPSGALNAAPTTGTFEVDQKFLVLAVNTNPTTTEKHVFATVGTGGGSKKSDQLVISPTIIIGGYVGGPEKSAVAMMGGEASHDAGMDAKTVPARREGHPIRVSFFSIDTSPMTPTQILVNGEEVSLYIDLPSKAPAGGSTVTLQFRNLGLLVEPTATDPEHPDEVIVYVPKDRRGISINVKAGPKGTGWVNVTATSEGMYPGIGSIYVAAAPTVK